MWETFPSIVCEKVSNMSDVKGASIEAIWETFPSNVQELRCSVIVKRYHPQSTNIGNTIWKGLCFTSRIAREML